MYRYLPLIAAILLLIGPAVAVPVTSAAIGDPVPLAGVAPGADWVYLFLTGPNLPSNGVRLDDISAPVISGDPSSFTRTSVDNDRWEYTWYTRTRGGVPDTGTYTIFIVTTPKGRKDLEGSEYATVMVSLGSPGLSILPDGGVTIGSFLPEAGLVSDGVQEGTSPEGLPGILPMNRSPGLRDGNDAGSDVTLTIPGSENTMAERNSEPQVNLSYPSPVKTRSAKISLPVSVVLAALTCASVPGIFGRKKRNTQVYPGSFFRNKVFPRGDLFLLRFEKLPIASDGCGNAGDAVTHGFQ